jgi:hypothetical protein
LPHVKLREVEFQSLTLLVYVYEEVAGTRDKRTGTLTVVSVWFSVSSITVWWIDLDSSYSRRRMEIVISLDRGKTIRPCDRTIILSDLLLHILRVLRRLLWFGPPSSPLSLGGVLGSRIELIDVDP